MIVKCIKIRPDEEDIKRMGDSYRLGKQAFPVKRGERYLVYSMSITKGNPWVHITNESDTFLFPVPLCLFIIDNPKFSKYWEIRLEDDGNLRFGPEPFLDKYFIDDLFEGVEEAVKEFERVRVLLENEHEV